MAWVEGTWGSAGGQDGCVVWATWDDAAPEGTDIYSQLRFDNVAGTFNQQFEITWTNAATPIVVPIDKGQMVHFHFIGDQQTTWLGGTLSRG